MTKVSFLWLHPLIPSFSILESLITAQEKNLFYLHICTHIKIFSELQGYIVIISLKYYQLKITALTALPLKNETRRHIECVSGRRKEA